MHPKAGPIGPLLTTPEPDLICEGERVPCRAAKRRVRQAPDLLRTHPSPPRRKPAASMEESLTQEPLHGAPSNGPLKVAAAYARVSSDRQEKEQTMAGQLEALTQAAQQRGYQLPSDLLFIDDGYSGARLDRPALDRLRDPASGGGVETVPVSSPDRLARNYA